MMTKPANSGRKGLASRPSASSASAKRTTSGAWAIPAPADPVRKSTSIRGRTWPAARTAASASATATVSLKSGTSCSCSSSSFPTAPASPCPARPSTPAWALNASRACARACAPTTTPTCSRFSSTTWPNSPASATATMPTTTPPCASSRTTAAPSPS